MNANIEATKNDKELFWISTRSAILNQVACLTAMDEQLRALRRAASKKMGLAESDDEVFDFEDLIDDLIDARGAVQSALDKLDRAAKYIKY